MLNTAKLRYESSRKSYWPHPVTYT